MHDQWIMNASALCFVLLLMAQLAVSHIIWLYETVNVLDVDDTDAPAWWPVIPKIYFQVQEDFPTEENEHFQENLTENSEIRENS